MTRGYTDADLLNTLAAFADREGRAPTAPEADDPASDLPTATTFARHFGSWNAALAAAGLSPRDRHRSDTELLADLQAFVENRGEHPSYAAVGECGDMDMATPQTYENRFGSWAAALRKAGLPAFADGE